MKNRRTPFFSAVLSLLAGLVFSTLAAGAQEASTAQLPVLDESAFEIGIGEARLLAINGIPKTIIVGDDTTIAANVIQGDILVFTGIAHGRTNVIVLDASGRIIEQVWVSVTKSGAPLTVRRGIVTEDFRCNPACRPEGENMIAPSVSDDAGVSG